MLLPKSVMGFDKCLTCSGVRSINPADACGGQGEHPQARIIFRNITTPPQRKREEVGNRRER